MYSNLLGVGVCPDLASVGPYPLVLCGVLFDPCLLVYTFMAEEMNDSWDLDEARRQILEFEPNIEDLHFNGYLVLMAACAVGCDHIYKLTRATKLGRDFVGNFVRRMRESGLFLRNQVCWEDCGGDPEHESLQFTLYVMVGLGLLNRHPDKDGPGSSYSSS